MAHIFLSDLKTTLDNCIAELEEIHFMFCKNPESDFTRNRKLSFRDFFQFMHLRCSAVLCLTTFTTVTGFWPAMDPMLTLHAILLTKGLLHI